MKSILKKLHRKWREKSGSDQLAYGLIALIAICFVTVFIAEFAYLINTVKHVRDGLDHAVLSCAADNAPDMFSAGREGISSITDYTDPSLSDLTWCSLLSVEDLERKLCSADGLGLVSEGNTLVKKNSEKTYFIISSLDISFSNPEYNAALGSSASITVSCSLHIPFFFLKSDLGPTIQLSTASHFIPVF